VGQERNVTKRKLLERAARRMKIPLRVAWPIIRALFPEIIRALAEGDTVRLEHFGKFTVYRWTQHNWKNPYTGEYLGDVPTYRVAFKLAPLARKHLNWRKKA
jgi:nucleoid DNA-binding protein